MSINLERKYSSLSAKIILKANLRVCFFYFSLLSLTFAIAKLLTNLSHIDNNPPFLKSLIASYLSYDKSACMTQHYFYYSKDVQ